MLCIICVAFAVIIATGDSMLTENKRSVIDLASVVEKVTGGLALKFASYGCYCGLGGRGEPLDEIDRCCKAHDNCYSSMHHNFWNYLRGYRYHLENGNVKCDSGDTATCRCDGKLAECLRDNMGSYNQAYELHAKHTC